MRFLLSFSLATLAVAASGEESLETAFRDTVQPFLRTHCVACHADQPSEGDLDLTADSNMESVIKNFRRWMVVLERLEAGDMPPEDADSHPSPQDRDSIVRWITRMRDAEASRTSGDPGVVLARRLSNAEYNYTIRDLTGMDIRPAQAFPIDPANEAGFDNSGESLTMSPALLKKHLEAARNVSEHLALTPTGFEFAPHHVLTDTDRDKFCVNRIIAFYRRQRTDYDEYFMALWRYQNRSKSDHADTTLKQIASEAGLSDKYAETLWSTLTAETDTVGPIAALQAMWRELPNGSTDRREADAQAQCDRMDNFITTLREAVVPTVENMTAPEVHKGSQPFVLWKNRQFAAHRRQYSGMAVPDRDFGLPPQSDAAAAMKAPSDNAKPDFDSAMAKFCSLFPDAFYVSERARVYLDQKTEKKLTGRFLSAGFHSQMGYFRDDQPLYDLMLNEAEQREIDRLWLELDFVTSAPMRQYAGFIWFDRTDSRFMRDREFDRFRAEDKDCTSEAKVRGLEDAYTAKAERSGASESALAAMHHYFDDMSAKFRRLERLHVDSEPIQIDALVEFTQRAYRRPLSQREKQSVRAFYRRLRQDDGLGHEDAIRDSVIRVLMSPHFCYRVDLPLPSSHDQAKQSIQPLSDVALASRLSYFLWSSMPDATLLELAESRRLHEPEVLIGQVRRMLRDDRARGFVSEFAGNWLDFRRFEQHNGVDRGRFPQFTDELRQAMYEEPVRFFLDLIVRDASILECLYADHTFVNAVLAKHYGAETEFDPDSPERWRKLERASKWGRGGLLPMAIFLTNNSPGLRTSPVKRGNWVVKRMFGEQIPAPPATVPELPEDESKLGDLTLRQALARHRADSSCAACHERIDSFGLVFEGYGPIGELRDVDLGGRAIDSAAIFPDDSEGRGLDGLREYVRQQRQDDFVENLCRKLLAYGLGRTLRLSDEATIAAMQERLAAENHRFGILIEVIVTSPAFLNRRANVDIQ